MRIILVSHGKLAKGMKDYGLNEAASENVIDYFNPMIHTGVMRVLAEELAKARKHPLTKRRYMWKLTY